MQHWDKIKFIFVLSLVAIVMISSAALVACTPKKEAIEYVDLDKVPVPSGYTYVVTDNETGEQIDSGSYTYTNVKLEGIISYHDNRIKSMKWESGPEDGMIYTIGYLTDSLNGDYSEYILYINDPSDKYKFVAAGVQTDKTYTLYEFIY